MPLILNVHSLDNTEDYSLVGVVASAGTASVVVGKYLREREETSIVWGVGVQGVPCWSRILVTHIDGKVVVAVVAGTTMLLLRTMVVVEVAFESRMVEEAGRMVGMSRERIVTNQIGRDWHMDLMVGSALHTSWVEIFVVEAEEYKAECCMLYVGEASLVAMDGSSRPANSLKQMMLQRKAVNGVVMEQEAWCKPEEGVASQWTTVVEPLPVLLASHAPNVDPKQKTLHCEKALHSILRVEYRIAVLSCAQRLSERANRAGR